MIFFDNVSYRLIKRIDDQAPKQYIGIIGLDTENIGAELGLTLLTSSALVQINSSPRKLQKEDSM